MESVRLDKWLWAARFFKTRALAADAVDLGRVLVNDERVKRARLVRIGDRLCVRHPPFEQVVVVRGLSEQRGPAPVAQALYEETLESREKRERVAAQVRAAGNAMGVEGRPTKRDRRAIDRWRGRDT